MPLIVVGRDACYEVAAPKDIYEELGNTESEIGKRLRDAAHETIDDLRRRAASTGAERSQPQAGATPSGSPTTFATATPRYS